MPFQQQAIWQVVAVAASIGIFAAGEAFAQCGGCNDCGSGVTYAQPTGNWGYPDDCPGGCVGGANYGGHMQNFKASVHAHQEQAEKVRARNAAWPKPFACADRSAYHAVWANQINAGWVNQCTLTDAHFDQQTGDLNGLGRSVVQGLMKNSPTSQQQIYVYDGPGAENVIDTETKKRNVESIIAQWYDASNVLVSTTDRWPLYGNGLQRETSNTLFAESTPQPIIVRPTGTGSTSDTQAGN